MKPHAILIDAHLSPDLGPWIEERFSVRCRHVRDAGLRDSDDGSIIEYARRAGVALLTKDGGLTERVGVGVPPPWVLLLAIGNTSNARLRQVLERRLPEAMRLLEEGEATVFVIGE